MKVVGFITEYNPFHLGHKYHLEESKKLSGADFSIAIMSGSFLQRGEPALVDKWTRAKMAIESGVDLVIELPFVYSCQSGEFFAQGGVNILNSLNIVDYISFGSESGNIDNLDEISKVIIDEPREYRLSLKENLNKGLSFPVSRSYALYDYFNSINSSIDILNTLKQSNNILAIEYLKALKKSNSKMNKITVARRGALYNELTVNKDFASATGIRNIINNKGVDFSENLVPEKTYSLLNNFLDNGNTFNSLDKYYSIIKYKLASSNKSDLLKIMDIEEGLENRFLEMIQYSESVSHLLSMVSTKRYPKTRLQRVLIHILMDFYKEDIDSIYSKTPPPYIRFLASNSKGLTLLKKIKEKSSIPIISKFADSKYLKSDLSNLFINYEVKSSNLYFLNTLSNNYLNMDYKQSPIILK